MRKLLIIPAMAGMMAIPSVVHADLFYAGLSAGVGYQYGNDRSFNATPYGAMVGLDFPFIRAELEYNYLTGSKKNHYSDTHIGMVNAYFDFLPTPVIRPYVGLGVGTFLGGKIDGHSVSSSMAYQGMLGLQFSIPATPLYVDTEMRVLFAFDVLPESADGSNYFQTDFRIKIRYSF